MSSSLLPQVLSPSTAQLAIEVAATLAFAASGLFEAARKRFDVVGVCTVMGLAAFGGGTLRDVLLDRRPFFWVEHSAWLWVFLGLGLFAMHVVRGRNLDPGGRFIQWPDALGLGLFTAVFGGVLRDIVCNEVPQAFHDHRPYAVCAFVGGWCVVLADTLAAPDWVGLVAGATVAFVLRALTMILDWRLPTWRPG